MGFSEPSGRNNTSSWLSYADRQSGSSDGHDIQDGAWPASCHGVGGWYFKRNQHGSRKRRDHGDRGRFRVRKIHAAWCDRGNAGAGRREDHDERKGDLRGVQCSGAGETPYESGIPKF